MTRPIKEDRSRMGDIPPMIEDSPREDALGKETNPTGTSLREGIPPKTGTSPMGTSPVIGISPTRTSLKEENLPETDTSPLQDKEEIQGILLRTEIGLGPIFSPRAGTGRTQGPPGIGQETDPIPAQALSPIVGLRADLLLGAHGAPSPPHGTGQEDQPQGTGLAGPALST